MASPLEVQLILCDAAQADPGGKLHMLGAGWSVTTTPTGPHAVAIMVKVPWDRANEKIHGALTLVDSDGRPLELPTPSGTPTTVVMEFDLEVGRPPGLEPGSMIDAAMAFNVGPLPVPSGRYQWRLDLGDQRFAASFAARGGTPS
ncbi:MAG: DUF6941 family protein [Pseudonocardiaceae bacterium]